MEDNWTLASYNLDIRSILLVVERTRSGARNKCTSLLRINSSALLDAVDSENLESSSSKNYDTPKWI